MMKNIILSILLLFFASQVYAASDTFPPSTAPPTVASILPSPAHIYYCAPTGNNTTGTGAVGSPWYDLRGAQSGGAGTPIAAGDLLYLRGGTYSTLAPNDWNNSDNQITTDGSSGSPIVITNYPGEIAQWSAIDGWSMSLSGDYQVLIGTMVGADYGIKFTGGVTINQGNYVKIHGVEFASGTDNEGDLNPAMISQPNVVMCTGTIISHCYFHDSVQPATPRMVCIRFFYNTNTVIEYNLFEDNLILYQGGAILFKDDTIDATVRYNKFINCNGGISYGVQGDQMEGIDIYGNLSYNSTSFIYLVSDLANADEINVYNNVVLGIESSFYIYVNNDNQTWSEPQNIYNNVIDGLSISLTDNANADLITNMPDLWDYNLWSSEADRTTNPVGPAPNTAGVDISSLGYYAHAVTNATLGITYDAGSMTVTAADDYPGLGTGSGGANIGGFTWTAAILSGGSIVGGVVVQ